MATQWFMAVVVRGGHVDGKSDDERMGDLLYRLVEASDAEAAYTKAVELGRASRDSYTAEDGKVISLEFLGLADLTAISANRLGDGVEVYSQLLSERPSEMVVPKEELTVFEQGTESTSFERGYDPIG